MNWTHLSLPEYDKKKTAVFVAIMYPYFVIFLKLLTLQLFDPLITVLFSLWSL